MRNELYRRRSCRRLFVVLAVICIQTALAQIPHADQYVITESVDFTGKPMAAPVNGINHAPVRFSVRNVSRKNITFLGYSLRVVYADGSESAAGAAGIDMVASYAVRRIPGPFSAGPIQTLSAGQVLQLSPTSVPFRSGDRAVRVRVNIDLLVFDDRTWLGDASTARMVFNSRRQMADQWNEVLKAVHSAQLSFDAASKLRDIAANSKETMVKGRLMLYARLLGTPTFGLMLNADEAIRDLTREQSVPAAPV